MFFNNRQTDDCFKRVQGDPRIGVVDLPCSHRTFDITMSAPDPHTTLPPDTPRVEAPSSPDARELLRHTPSGLSLAGVQVVRLGELHVATSTPVSLQDASWVLAEYIREHRSIVTGLRVAAFDTAVGLAAATAGAARVSIVFREDSLTALSLAHASVAMTSGWIAASTVHPVCLSPDFTEADVVKVNGPFDIILASSSATGDLTRSLSTPGTRIMLVHSFDGVAVSATDGECSDGKGSDDVALTHTDLSLRDFTTALAGACVPSCPPVRLTKSSTIYSVAQRSPPSPLVISSPSFSSTPSALQPPPPPLSISDAAATHPADSDLPSTPVSTTTTREHDGRTVEPHLSTELLSERRAVALAQARGGASDVGSFSLHNFLRV